MPLLDQAYNRDAYLDFLVAKFRFEKLPTSIDIDTDEADAISSNMQHKGLVLFKGLANNKISFRELIE